MQLGVIFFTAFNAILPIILLIVLGNFLRRIGFLTDDFVKVASKFVFRVCLSCSLFINVYSIQDFSSIRWDFVLYIVVAICVLFVLGLAAALSSTRDPRQKGVILHSVFRSNFAIIGLPLASALGGQGAATVASVAAAFALPLYNIFGVIALTMFVDGQEKGKHSIRRVLLSIIKNPMIIGAFFGMVCLAVRELQVRVFGEVVFSIKDHTPFLYTAVNNLKTVASPLALVVLGAQFKFSAVKGMFRQIAVGTLWRIVLAPVLCVGGAMLLSTCTDLLSCGVNEYPTLIALFGSPAAVSTAVMAGEMGNDEQLATQIVVWTSLGSVLTIFLQVCLLMATGFLSG